MNRLAGFALIGGFLASAITASGASAEKTAYDRSAHLAAPTVQVPMASVVQALPAPAATQAPSNVTQRIIPAAQPAAHAALPPAAAEQAPASTVLSTSCPPAHTDIACHKP